MGESGARRTLTFITFRAGDGLVEGPSCSSASWFWSSGAVALTGLFASSSPASPPSSSPSSPPSSSSSSDSSTSSTTVACLALPLVVTPPRAAVFLGAAFFLPFLDSSSEASSSSELDVVASEFGSLMPWMVGRILGGARRMTFSTNEPCAAAVALAAAFWAAAVRASVLAGLGGFAVESSVVAGGVGSLSSSSSSDSSTTSSPGNFTTS